MESTRELEDTLPFYPPPKLGDGRDPMASKFAVYSLIPMDDAGRQHLLDDLNEDNGFSTSNCCLAPSPDFANRTLRDVYDYHIQVYEKDDNEVYPHFFIVADRENWKTKGVLVVNLQTDRYLGHGLDNNDDYELSYELVIGVGRCGVDMADCVGCNLEIANVNWVEFKEEWQREWEGEDPYTNKRYFRYNDKGLEN